MSASRRASKSLFCVTPNVHSTPDFSRWLSECVMVEYMSTHLRI